MYATLCEIYVGLVRHIKYTPHAENVAWAPYVLLLLLFFWCVFYLQTRDSARREGGEKKATEKEAAAKHQCDQGGHGSSVSSQPSRSQRDS